MLINPTINGMHIVALTYRYVYIIYRQHNFLYDYLFRGIFTQNIDKTCVYIYMYI